MWAETWRAIYEGKTAKERIAANKKVSEEQIRLRNLDAANGSSLLYEFTIKYKPNFGELVMAEIEDSVPMPTGTGWASPPPQGTAQAAQEAPPAPEAPKRRGRKPKAAGEAPAAKPGKAKSQAAELEAALAFVEPCATGELIEAAEYVNLSGNMAIAYNGQIAAGHVIVEALNCAPKLAALKTALSRTGKTLTLTETGNGSLSVQGERLRAVVPCAPLENMAQMTPDAPAIEGDFDGLKQAFKACSVLANENGQRVIEASLLLQNNTVTSTNGYALLQYWHGYNVLPGDFVLPKAFCDAVAKSPLKIVALGGGWNGELFSSFTVHFENGAWYKTQTYFDRWPAIDHIIGLPATPIAVPEGFWEGVEAVAKLSEDESKGIHLNQDNISNSRDTGANYGAEFSLPGLNANLTINSELLLKLQPYIQTFDLTSHSRQIMFFGENGKVRGTLMVMQ